jgi:ATP-dependent RNA helicase DeaD
MNTETLLWYKKEAADFDSALPVGCGRLGGMVFGGAAKEIIKLINDRVKGQKVEIGRIDLLKNISFVEVADEDADRVMKALKGTRVKGREIVVDWADGPNRGSHDKSTKSAQSAKPKKKGKKEQYPTEFFDAPTKPDKKKKKDKKQKPSREERGYTEPRGRKFKKEDWMKFLHPEK